MSDLVLLHGVGLDHRMWDRCLPALAAVHSVHAPDLPGHGAAGTVPDGTTLGDLAREVTAGLAGPAHVAGFSLGALVAQQLALTRPELVRSLVLVSSVANRSPAEAAAVRGRLNSAMRSFPSAAEAALERWMPREWQDAEPGLAEDLRNTLLRNDLGSYLACYRVFATADAGLWPRLPDITAPTLAVTGSDDAGSTPDMSRRLAAEIPHARAVVVPGARHLLPLQAPRPLTELILNHTKEVEHGPVPSLHRR